MASAQKKKPSPKAHVPHPRVTRLGQAGRICLKGLHISFRTFLVLLLMVSAVLGYLHWVGFPAWMIERWIQGQEEQERFISAERLTFNVFSGLVAHEFAGYQTQRRAIPMLETDRVELEFDLLRWLAKKPAWVGIVVRDGTFRYASDGLLLAAAPDQIITVEDLAATITWEEETVHVRKLTSSILGIRVRGEGIIDLGPDGPSLSSFRGRAPGEANAGRPAWLTELIEQLNAITFETQPTLDASFMIYPNDLERTLVELSGKGGQTSLRGVHFDRWDFQGLLKSRMFEIRGLKVYSQDRRWSSTGAFNTETRLLKASIDCDLPPVQWLSLLPIAVRDRVEEVGFSFSGPMHVTADLGPAPLKLVWKEFSGTVKAREASFQGVWFDALSSRFTCDENRLEINSLEASLGRGGEWGTVDATFSWTWPEHTYEGTARSYLDFAAIIPLVNPKMVNLIQSFTLNDKPAFAEVTFAGQKGDPEAFHLHGNVIGTNLFYRGAFFNQGTSGLTISNRVVTLDPLHVERDEGNAGGTLVLDVRNRRFYVDMAGRIEARPLGLACGPAVERILRTFEFGAPVEASVKGPIDLNDWEKTHLSIQARSKSFGIRSFVSDEIEADILWTNRTVDVQAFDATLYGGLVSGRFATHIYGKGEPLGYDLDAQIANVNFEEVIRTWLHREGEPYRGFVYGALKLSGRMGAGQGAATSGTGSIRIEEGRLMSIPLLGGLSRGLSKIYPGLGFTKQTDFKSDFSVTNLMLRTSNLSLEGDVFNLIADGKYGIADQSLDFDVEFGLLRAEGVGKVVKLVTMPLSKLLRFDLSGTREDPQWRPKNLPKELFGDFD